MIEEKLPPGIVMDFWAAERPGKQPVEWELLNEEHENSEKWGYAVYKIIGGDCSPLYVALQGTHQGLTVRKLDEKEITFLTTGEIPDEGLPT